MKQKTNKKKHRILIPIILLVLAGICLWKVLRASCVISCRTGTEPPAPSYSERERVLDAMSLSYLVYGCEGCEDPSGTVSELLAANPMGILTENFGIRRTNPGDPSSACIDASAFIRFYVGEFRFLTALRDSKSGFYGAAFCDDANRCVWIAYSGSVSARDMLACVELAAAPGLSAQETSAFALYETVLDSEEVKNGGYAVLLTGHSLGGALAAMVSRVSGCEAVTINGADGVAINKINDILGEKKAEYRISNYMTSPNNGRFSWMDLVQRLTFLGSYRAVDYHVYEENGLTDDTHCVFSFIRYVDGRPELPVPLEEK